MVQIAKVAFKVTQTYWHRCYSMGHVSHRIAPISVWYDFLYIRWQ